MKTSVYPVMKTVAWLLFSLFIVFQSQNAQSAGSCGSANNKNYITDPEGRLAEVCSSGTLLARTDNPDLWRWRCTDANCSANKVRCGSANGTTTTTTPTGTTMCDPDNINTPLVLTGNTWNWTCRDSEGAEVACQAAQRVNGTCGTAISRDYVNPPSANLCATGTATAVVNDGTDYWDWNCAGINGGSQASCTADIVNCGTLQGTNQPTQPSGHLCSEGTASTPIDSGDTWTWTCTDNIGDIASCWANDRDNGGCGTAQGTNSDLAPTLSSALCSSGTPTVVTDSGARWTWTCNGTFGGTNVNCWANDLDNGVCGTAISTPTESAPAANLCSSGNASAVTDGGTTWGWTCNGISGGTSVNCATGHIADGDCGPANGRTYETEPTSGLCTAGVASAVTPVGRNWDWNCAGVSGGTDASCTANRVIVNNYCSQPPFLVTVTQPNVMSVIDASGSMSWKAYNYASTAVPVPVYTGDEEGYFRPDKNYRYNNTTGPGSYWEETITGGVTACPGNSDKPENSKIYKGSCMNYHAMSRMDLVRWAMTGGRPQTCSNNNFSVNECDPELWDQLGNTAAGKVGTVCNDTLGGCILETTTSYNVKVPWSRILEGLAFQFKELSLKPRMGAMFYSDSTVRSAGQVYMGDYSASGDAKDEFPYQNLITAINSTSPGGSTPTGPAMWDAFNYFQQKKPVHGGLPIQLDAAEDSEDKWKNPMYVCDEAKENCKEISCAKNFVLLMSDGQWNTPSCSSNNSSTDPVVPAYQMHQTFTNALTGKTTNVKATHSIGIFLGGTGEQSLKNVAMYGSFNKSEGWPDSLTGYPQGECDMDDCGSDGKGSGCTALPASSNDWDNDTPKDIPDTFHSATNGAELKAAIKKAILDMMEATSSGTAVSVLSSSEGSGANLMQALFYPKRTFPDGSEVAWTSDLMNYWYYVDPYFTSATIREDMIREGATASTPYTLLDLKEDYVTRFTYNATTKKTEAHRWQDTTGKGSPLTDKGTLDIESTLPIWRAGFDLWWTLPTARNIYTSVDVAAATTATAPAAPTLIPFTVAKRDDIDDYLGLTASTVDANSTINYIRGYDCVNATGADCTCGTAGCYQIGRSRTVTSGVCSTRKNPCESVANCSSGETCDVASNVWKFGDIISSTPRIMGPGSLNSYNNSSPNGYADPTYDDFIESLDYKNRQLVFVGANDGMLHAFKLGKLQQKWTGKQWYQAARQEGDTGAGGIGTESWAYIPKNVLPYLPYLHDKDYCHIYTVDGPTTVNDVAINKTSTSSCTAAEYWKCPKQTTVDATTKLVDYDKTSWRTVLVGSAGLGGATCDAASHDSDRIDTPISVSGKPVGWSSYYALDVTDQTTPKLLWEFSNPNLGVTNVGPAIVKVGGNEKRCAINNAVCTSDDDCNPVGTKGSCTATNGRWLAVLASGSTGPISELEFKGKSDKSLKLFVLDLKTGALLRTIDTGAGATNLGITNAFAGSISGSALDLERDRPFNSGNYQDDVLYIGYVKSDGATTPSWNQGGVIRLVLNDDINPNNWTVSKVIDGIGPVTTSVANLIDRKNKKVWIYFSEGRYFYKLDDVTGQRRLYGIEDPCFDGDANTIPTTCTSSVTTAALKDQTTTVSTTLTAAQKGWFVDMNAAAGEMGSERVISNPTPSTQGAVYFISFAPNSNVCSYGGMTYLWALNYSTGGTVTNQQGKALIQVSTGEIKELDLKDAFTDKDNRKSVGFAGIPPAGQAMSLIGPPTPIKKFMNVQEQ